jgi:phosphoenolpyruvate---glycerone phosphotransferase subunit DhaL
MLTSPEIAGAIERIDAGIAPIRDELNAADRRLGDGDTGMTVAQVVGAWKAAGNLPADVGAALICLGRETGRATGSSLGSVLATGLSAAGRAGCGREAIDCAGVVALLGAATAAITARSGATAGDKSILDSLLRIESSLDSKGRQDAALDIAADAATAALAEFRNRESRIGRARMYGAQSAGHDDPGMLAVVLLLTAARHNSLQAME